MPTRRHRNRQRRGARVSTLNEYEIKVTYTAFIGVEAYSKELAIEEAKNIVAHQYNGQMSEDSDYKIISE
jgi:hypothetical protein